MSESHHAYHVESPALGAIQVDVHRVEGIESLNRPWRFHVSLWTREARLTREHRADLLEQPIELAIMHRGVEVRRFRGVVAELVERAQPGDGHAVIEVVVVPQMAQLGLSRKTEFYLQHRVPGIVAEKLRSWGLLEHRDFVFVLGDDYPVLEFVTQHAESDLDFLSRLCEGAGIAFWFEERDGREVLVVSDSADAFPKIARADAVRFGPRESDHTAFELATSMRRRASDVVVHDYNYRTPRVDLLQASTTGAAGAEGTRVEYGIHSKTPDESKRYARVRAEEEAWTHHVVIGKTNEFRLSAGSRFRLVDATGDEQELVVVELTHHFEHGRGEHPITAHNAFRALPASVRYRPLRVTARPRIPGLVHAIVDGAIKGQYAEVDGAGRYHVRFGFDRSGRTDLQASRPVRMLQPHSGARYGMHFPLRPGTEVLVGFVEGDPDRPMIVGAIPNPETPSPVDRANVTENVLRSGANNELVMEDLQGRERVRLHTPLHATTLQLGSFQEREEGALLKTDAHITMFARDSIDSIMSRATSLTRTLTTLVGDSAVLVAGLPALADTEGAIRGYEELSRRMGVVRSQLDFLSQAREPDASPRPPEGGDETGAAPSHGTFSGIGASLSDGANQMALDASERLAKRADEDAVASQSRSSGQALQPVGGPRLVLGALSNATVFARDTALVHADRAAVLASDDTARVVGARKVDIQSPEQVEIAAVRSVQVSSANYVDLYGKQLSLFAVEEPGKLQDPLTPEVSMALLAEKELRLKSGTAAIRACAEKDFVIHSHQENVRIVAKRTVHATGGSIVGSAGKITLTSSGDIAVESAGDTTLKADNVIVEASSVTIHAGKITLDGNVIVTGSLDVGGKINQG